MRWFTARPILVLVLGSTPLAALTVASFARIGQVSDELPAAEDFNRAGEALLAPSEQLEGDAAVSRALAERELFAGEALAMNDKLPDPAFFVSLREDWDRWLAAQKLIDDVLQFERRLVDADRRGLEQAALEVRRLSDVCGKGDATGSSQLVRALYRRSEEIQERIHRLREIENARRLISEANAAAERQEHDRAVELCDEILAKYTGALEPAELSVVRARRGSSQFRRDWLFVRDQVQGSDDVARKRDWLKNFLAKYADPGSRASAEREIVVEAEARLLAMEAEAVRLERNRAAQRPIEMLAQYDSKPFPDGLRAAAEIAKEYPTDTVRACLQDRVRGWLATAVPAKRLAEPADLEEAELADGQVLRGYFAATTDAGGRITGYKCYKSAEERRNPTAAVGRYPADEFRRPPGATVLRGCALRYEEARRAALDHPNRPIHWTALAATCESIGEELQEYRRKPGSSREPLSFDAEGRFAQALLTPAPWSNIEEVWAR